MFLKVAVSCCGGVSDVRLLLLLVLLVMRLPLLPSALLPSLLLMLPLCLLLLLLRVFGGGIAGCCSYRYRRLSSLSLLHQLCLQHELASSVRVVAHFFLGFLKKVEGRSTIPSVCIRANPREMLVCHVCVAATPLPCFALQCNGDGIVRSK